MGKEFNDLTCEELCDLMCGALEEEEEDYSEDCISRAELLKAVDTWDKFGCDADTKLVPIKDCYVPYIHYDDVVKAIKGMPSIQPKPNTGHWIAVIEEIDRLENKTWHYECSICGNKNSGWGDFKYCPNCGAKMESEEV